MSRLELSAGAIEYRDTGGAGRLLVLLHGVLMDGGQWREVVSNLTPENRCILPTLP
jgi:pimeloyl-ACP methyl ester carboxylesterase